MTLPFFTIGHSTRTIGEFVALLGVGDVALVVDIRTVRRSRTNPQYDADALPASLAAHRIGCESIAELGGLRGKSKAEQPGTNGYWENQSFHNYADYALSDAFRGGLDRLIALGRGQRTAVMCSEAVWWRCHRRIVGDYLIQAGIRVIHIMGSGKIVPATLTEGAVPTEAGIVYPATQPPAAPNATADARP